MSGLETTWLQTGARLGAVCSFRHGIKGLSRVRGWEGFPGVYEEGVGAYFRGTYFRLPVVTGADNNPPKEVPYLQTQNTEPEA